MLRSLSAGALTALALLTLALPLQGQEEATEAPPTPLPQDSVQDAMARFQALDQRVNQVQDQALQANPELQQEQTAIQQDIETAMFEAHPDLQVALQERLPAMQEEAASAQAAQDTTRLQALNNEYQGIMSRVEAAQTEVVEEAAMRARLTSFQTRVMEAMVLLDPEIEGVFAQLRALASRLDATLGG